MKMGAIKDSDMGLGMKCNIILNLQCAGLAPTGSILGKLSPIPNTILIYSTQSLDNGTDFTHMGT